MSEENTQITKVMNDIKNDIVEVSVAKDAFAVIDEINKLSLITPANLKDLKDAQTFLMSTYTDVPAFRTYIEKCVGVLTNSRFPTPDSKFWQCKKEAEVQFNELLKCILRHKSLMVDVDEVMYQLQYNVNESDTTQFLKRRLNIKLAELNLQVKSLEKEIKYRIVEIHDWHTIAKEWEPKMKHSKDNYTPHEVESLTGYLSREIERSQDTKDNKTTEMLKSQLASLHAMLNRKVQTLIKENRH